jgi:HEAT repeat protein
VNEPRFSFPVSEGERQRIERIDLLIASGEARAGDLIVQLADPSWTVRRAVVSALAALGDQAIGPLVERLTHDRGDETVLAAVVEALVASTGDVEPALARLCAHRHPPVLADVAQVLGRRRNPAAVPLLQALAEHDDDNVAVSAIEALGRVGSRAAVEGLLASLGSGNFFRVFPTIDVLGRSGDPRVIKPLASLLDNRHYALEAARALGRTGERGAVGPLAGLLRSSALADVRVAAVALAQLEDEYESRYGVTAPLREALRRSLEPRAITRRLGQALAGADPDERAAICVLLGTVGDQAAIPLLMQVAPEPDPVGTAAHLALQEVGRRSDDRVVEALRSSDGAARKAMLKVVSHQALTGEVVACLDDPDPEVRAAAADALARIGETRAVPALFERLADSSALVVQSAISAIQSLGSPDTASLALAGARAPSPAVRRWSLRILAYFGYERTTEVFLAGVADPDPRVQESALYGLAFLDDPRAREALLAASHDPEPRVRAAAMRAFGQGVPEARMQASILRGLADPEPWVRYYACQAAGRLRVDAAIEGMVGLLDDGAGQVRVGAVDALSHFDHPAARRALLTAVTAGDAELRQAALVAVGIARLDEALPAVLAAVTAPAASTRLLAVSALSSFDDASAIQALRQAADDSDESVRTAALSALGHLGGPQPAAALIAVLRECQATDARRVVQALSIPARGRIAAIVSELGTADDELAPSLTAALARMQDAAAAGALIGALTLPNPAARRAAAVTLGGVGSTDALAALRHAAVADGDSDVRHICAAVLGGA